MLLAISLMKDFSLIPGTLFLFSTELIETWNFILDLNSQCMIDLKLYLPYELLVAEDVYGMYII